MNAFSAGRYIVSVFVFAAIFFCAYSPVPAAAQARRFDESDITLKVSPENPGAFQTVTFSVSSFLFNANSQNISWSVDGKTVRSGIGATSFSVETKAIGSTTTVTMVLDIDGESIRKTVTLRPAEIDLLWESANGYVPPFYRGRALPTKESSVRVVAIPSVKVGTVPLKSSDFTYSWKRAGGIVNAASGYSKNSFVFQKDFLNPAEALSVTITGVGNTYTATKDISIPSFDPQILLYERHPLLGIQYEKELGPSLTLPVGEKTIIAEPYFMSAIGPTSSYLNYVWKINGAAISTPSKKNQLTLRGSGQEGASRVSLDVENITKLFEEASRFLSITLTN